MQLSYLKESALKDLLVTAPEMIAAAFTKSNLIQLFVPSGILDEKFKRCADLYGLISSFKIDWNKINGEKRWFMTVLPYVISDIFSEGEVTEQFYDDNNFPLDRDHRGEVWRLKSTADHLTRYKVIYHPTVIEKK